MSSNKFELKPISTQEIIETPYSSTFNLNDSNFSKEENLKLAKMAEGTNNIEHMLIFTRKVMK